MDQGNYSSHEAVNYQAICLSFNFSVQLFRFSNLLHMMFIFNIQDAAVEGVVLALSDGLKSESVR